MTGATRLVCPGVHLLLLFTPDDDAGKRAIRGFSAVVEAAAKT